MTAAIAGPRSAPHAWPDHDLLTAEEEKDLARRRDAGDLDARNELVTRNLRYAALVARCFCNRHTSFRVDDADSAAAEGLIRAADRFDPEAGCRFITYARAWIVSFVEKEHHRARYPVKVPHHADVEARALAAGRTFLTKRQPDAIYDAVRRVQAAGVIGSASGPRDDPSDLLAGLVDHKADDPAERADRAELMRRVERAIDRLPEKEALVLRLRYGLTGDPPASWKAIGKALGRSYEWARKLEEIALRRLTRMLEVKRP